MRCIRTRVLLLASILSVAAGAPGAPAARRMVIVDQDAFGGVNLQPLLMFLQAPDVEVLGITIESGDGWQKDYEQKNGAGSLDRAHTEIIIGFATMPVTGILLLLIYLQATADRSGGYSLQNRKKFKEPKKEW